MKIIRPILRFLLTPARLTALATSISAALLHYLNQVAVVAIDPAILQGTIEGLLMIAATAVLGSGAAEARKAIQQKKDQNR